MKAWEANLDVQFVTNVYSCVMYLASYVSKPEKTLGDVLKAVSKSSQHLGAKQSMRSVAQSSLPTVRLVPRRPFIAFYRFH